MQVYLFWERLAKVELEKRGERGREEIDEERERERGGEEIDGERRVWRNDQHFSPIFLCIRSDDDVFPFHSIKKGKRNVVEEIVIEEMRYGKSRRKRGM